MLMLQRNKSEFWYATYAGKTPIKNADGLPTGEMEITYNPPVKCAGNISPASGIIVSKLFGADESYDLLVMLAGTGWHIGPGSVVWVGTDPPSPHNYAVSRVAESLNSTSIALKRVEARA